MDIAAMYLIAVVAITAGVYTVDNLLLETERDGNWYMFVVCGALVMAIPITWIASGDIESAFNVFSRIVR